MKKTILVTGGAGFIGSHLCRKLLQMGNKVICFDNLYTGRKTNISDLLTNEDFTFVEGDIVAPFYFECDEIYNLACPASPPHYQFNPIKTAQTNFIGMYNVLELARKTGAKVLQASTSEVYGDPEVHPQIETYRGNVNPDGIRSCYDEGKRIAETLCYDYNRIFGIKVAVVRIFNTYGPNMREDDGRVVSNFIWQALNNNDITIYGDGSQTRSFCFVSDLVDGIIKAMEVCANYPINLGNPGEFTVKELADIILNLVKTNSNIVYKDLPLDDPTRRKPDISLAKNTLNWEPKIKLEEGLNLTIDYFKQLIN